MSQSASRVTMKLDCKTKFLQVDCAEKHTAAICFFAALSVEEHDMNGRLPYLGRACRTDAPCSEVKDAPLALKLTRPRHDFFFHAICTPRGDRAAGMCVYFTYLPCSRAISEFES